MMKQRNRQTGFTLIETMIVLVIVGISVSIGLPMMQGMLTSSLAKRTTGLFELDLNFTRSSAVSRGETVRMSPRDNDIANGWVIIAQRIDGSQETLRERGSLDKKVSITSPDGLDSIAFRATGQIETGGTIVIRTSGCQGNQDKSFTLLNSGQIAVTELACKEE